MIAVTDRFLTALRGSHGLANKATIMAAGIPMFDVPIESGQVTIDRTQAVRRTLDLTVSDPSFYPLAPGDPVGVWGTEIQVWRGIDYGNGDSELVSEGVFRIDTVERDDPAGGVQITGSDRSMQVQEEMFLTPRRIPEMTGVALISMLLQEVYPNTTVDSSGLSANDTIHKHTVPQDRWGEITRVAQILGGEVFADENGNWVIQDIPEPSTGVSVWQVDAGADGVMVGANRSSTRVAAPNTVVATSKGVVTFSADSFTGNRPSGWGQADIGGLWNIVSGSAGDLDVSGARGEVSAAQNATKKMTLQTNAADCDTTVILRFQSSGTGNGGDLNMGMGARALNGNNYVRLNANLQNSNGHVVVNPDRVVGGTVTSLGSGKDLGSVGTNSGIYVRLRLEGNSVKAKAWTGGSSNEPGSWDWDTTQTQLPGAGDVILYAIRGSANTAAAPQFSFDSMKCIALGVVYGVAYDTDPNSPTYYLGPYGIVPTYVTSGRIRSQTQADRLARARLKDLKGATRTISLANVPNPALDAGDVVTVVTVDGQTEIHILDAITLPLDAGTDQSADSRVATWTAA